MKKGSDLRRTPRANCPRPKSRKFDPRHPAPRPAESGPLKRGVQPFPLARSLVKFRLKLLGHLPRCGIAPGRSQCTPKHILLGGSELHTGCALLAPLAVHRAKCGGFDSHKLILLLPGQFDHPAGPVWISESRKNFALDPEVRMLHVRAFCGFRKT